MSSVFAKRVPLWPFLLVIVLILGLLGAGLVVAAKAIPNFPLFGSDAEVRNTQVINALKREEQVVLLSLGVQGISEGTDRTDFNGWEIPGTERASFMEYGFTAKVGIPGQDVAIEQTGENEYRVSIPEFIFIGHDDATFRLVTEKNGALSWATPPIDPVEMVNDVLDDETKGQYIENNRDILRDQTEAFYNGIIHSVDPGIVVHYEFTD